MTDREALLFGLGILSQLADAHTTKVALESGMGSEANPIAKGILKIGGYPGLYVAKAALSGYIVADAVRKHPADSIEREESAVMLILFGIIPAANNAGIALA